MDTNDNVTLAQHEALDPIEKQKPKITMALSTCLSENLNSSSNVVIPINEGYSAPNNVNFKLSNIQNTNSKGQVDSTSDQDTVKIQVNLTFL